MPSMDFVLFSVSLLVTINLLAVLMVAGAHRA